MPKYSFQRKDPMTPEEVKGMMDATDSMPMISLMAFLYLYGTRIGEPLKLQKADFKVWLKSLTVNIQVEKKRQTKSPILWKHPLTVKIRPENDFFVQAILAPLG